VLVPTRIRERASQSFRGLIPVRLEGAPDSILTGVGQWRGIANFEHATICRAFGLDQCRFYFDLPSSCRGTGSASSGWGGGRQSRVVNGYVMMGGRNTPVGKLTICFESEKFKDVDPSSMRDFLDLGHS
jgi:hypothetical protein